MPATSTGKPARNAAVRPMVVCTPCCSAAPMITSSTSAGSTFARSIAARIGCAARVGEGVVLNAPRYALPIPVRAVETITASRIPVSSNVHQAEPFGGQCGLLFALDFDRHPMAHQQLSRRFLLNRVKDEAPADALARADRCQKADTVEPVIDRHREALGQEHRLGAHAREQRQ